MSAILNAADHWLNLLRVELDVFTDNTAAIALYEKFGFEHEGVQQRAVFGPGGWRDSAIMARLREPSYQSQLSPFRPHARPADSQRSDEGAFPTPQLASLAAGH